MAKFSIKPSMVAGKKSYPVLLLLDRSSSMRDERISELNSSVQKMIAEFSSLCKAGQNIQVAVISFGDDATLHRHGNGKAFAPASDIEWKALVANGYTNFADAIRKAKQLLTAKDELPRPSAYPLVVLVSDGEPYPEGDWRACLDDFVLTPPTSKCGRLALMVGSDQIPEAMQRFAEGSGTSPWRAKEAGGIAEFFKHVTMTVTSTITGKTPRAVHVPPPVKASPTVTPSMMVPIPEDDAEFGDLD